MIGVNWPHHVFVNQNFKVVGAGRRADLASAVDWEYRFGGPSPPGFRFPCTSGALLLSPRTSEIRFPVGAMPWNSPSWVPESV